MNEGRSEWVRPYRITGWSFAFAFAFAFAFGLCAQSLMNLTDHASRVKLGEKPAR